MRCEKRETYFHLFKYYLLCQPNYFSNSACSSTIPMVVKKYVCANERVAHFIYGLKVA